MVKKSMHNFFVVSIDLESLNADLSFEHHRNVRRTAEDLVRLFDRHQIAATWAVADPGNDAVTAPILSSGSSHEIALQGNAIWPETRTTRADFSGRLQRNLYRAQERAIPIDSIVGLEIPDDHTDLLVKNRIRFLRYGNQNAGRTPRWSTPDAVRYGVWNLPESCRFPGPKSWLSDITSSRFKRMVRTAAARRQTMHLVVDAVQVAQAPAANLKTLDAVLSTAVRYQQLNQLQIATMAQTVDSMTQRPVRQATRSILKVA